MNIWFMVWVFIAVFVLGTSLWSYYILLKQKRAWGGFAKKYGLEYTSMAFLKSPGLRGSFKGLPLVVCSDRPLSGKSNDTSTRTTIQFSLKAPMPTVGAIGSSGFRNYIGGLTLPEDYKPDFQGWNAESTVRAEKVEALVPFLSKERLTALNALLGIKTCATLLIFSSDATILRMETTEPFDDAERFDKFLSKAADAAKVISL